MVIMTHEEGLLLVDLKYGSMVKREGLKRFYFSNLCVVCLLLFVFIDVRRFEGTLHHLQEG